MTSTHDEDARVADAFRAGDEAALGELYTRWSPLVYSLALRSLDDVAEAEAVTREVFLHAWASRSSFEPERVALSDWLVDLACLSITETRAEADRRDVTTTKTDQSAGRESKTGALAERLLVADGMSHLEMASRRVLQMALDHDLTLGEIAGRTGLRVDEVRSRVAASLMELRQQLEGKADAH